MPTTNTAHLDLDRIDLRILRLVLILSNTQSLTKTAAAMKPENRGIYTQSDSSKKSSRNIWSLAVVSVDQRY